MSLIFETIQTEGIAAISYLVGDDSAGVAAIVDPTPDVEKYVALAREKQVAVTHIFETHIHADFVSGARELQDQLQSAKIFASHEGGAEYGFDHEPLRDGDAFTFGETIVTARHTPGHTPEHVSYLLAESSHKDAPWGVLSGDSLFVSSAGRPDLLGSDETEQLTQQLFHTLRDFYLALPDSLMVFPAHGHGSPCGADIGDRLQSTIGYERRFNSYLQTDDLEAFKKLALEGAPPVPKYYPRMKEVNARGPKVLGRLPRVPALSPEAFKKAVDEKRGVVVDTRTMLGFGGGHVKNALNIGGTPMLSIWAGWLLEPDEPILLVVGSDQEVETVAKYFLRSGYTNFAGYLAGGMPAWGKTGYELAEVGQMTVHELRRDADRLQIVDVRTPSEWKGGHVPQAKHIFLPELPEKSRELDPNAPTAVYCGSGYRASIGTSILKQQGFECVCNIPGSWQAWKSADYPVQKEED